MPEEIPTAPARTPRSGVQLLPIGEDQNGQRLDRVLSGLLPGVPRSRIFRLIRKGEVRVNGKRATPEQRLQNGDTLRVPPVRDGLTPPAPAAPEAPRVPVTLTEQLEKAIVFEDEKLIALDKPSGLAVHGGSGLSFGVIEALRAARPEQTLELAHRLDRDTSGCLLITKTPAALRTLHALLRDGEVHKSYLVLVMGGWELGHKIIDIPLRTDTRVSGERTVRAAEGGKSARTEFRLIERYGSRASLLEATLHTGRTHQIRVHAAYCKHPVAGDEKYGDKEFNTEMCELGLARMFLHSHHCSFAWPGGSDVDISVPLPDALKVVLDQLSLKSKQKRRGGAVRDRRRSR